MPLFKQKNNLIEPIWLHLHICGPQIYHEMDFFISLREIFECTDDEDQIIDQQTNFLMTFFGVNLLPKVIIKDLSISEETLAV